MTVIIKIVSLLALSTLILAENIYVDNESGFDTDDCGASSSPCETVEHVLSTYPDGGITILGGTVENGAIHVDPSAMTAHNNTISIDLTFTVHEDFTSLFLSGVGRVNRTLTDVAMFDWSDGNHT